jgi:hypothetical protein
MNHRILGAWQAVNDGQKTLRNQQIKRSGNNCTYRLKALQRWSTVQLQDTR